MVCEALYETVIGTGLACMDEVLETERVALCGERYEHLRYALRAGLSEQPKKANNQSCRASIRCHSIHSQIRVPCEISWPSRDALALSGSFEATYHCAAVPSRFEASCNSKCGR
jgi:hypothetical protein